MLQQLARRPLLRVVTRQLRLLPHSRLGKSHVCRQVKIAIADFTCRLSRTSAIDGVKFIPFYDCFVRDERYERAIALDRTIRCYLHRMIHLHLFQAQKTCVILFLDYLLWAILGRLIKIGEIK